MKNVHVLGMLEWAWTHLQLHLTLSQLFYPVLLSCASQEHPYTNAAGIQEIIHQTLAREPLFVLGGNTLRSH